MFPLTDYLVLDSAWCRQIIVLVSGIFEATLLLVQNGEATATRQCVLDTSTVFRQSGRRADLIICYPYCINVEMCTPMCVLGGSRGSDGSKHSHKKLVTLSFQMQDHVNTSQIGQGATIDYRKMRV